MSLEEPEITPALDPGEGRLVHQVVEPLVADVVEPERAGRAQRQQQAEGHEPGGRERPDDQHPGNDVDRDQGRATPPGEGESLLLLLVVNVEGVVELAELVVNERVGRETVLGEPGAMEPVAMERPLEKAGLHGSHRDYGERGEDFQTDPLKTRNARESLAEMNDRNHPRSTQDQVS